VKGAVIGKSPALAALCSVANQVAPTDTTVLITGESGVGKKLLADILHAQSRRHAKPFVAVDFGAIARELQEAELFGYEEGVFSHVIHGKPGRLEMAQGGTLFLDVIDAMDLPLQAKIVRVLQEKQFERIGATHPRELDVRVVAATSRDLENEVEAGRFRADLFYRLNVIPLHLPPLRERGSDILLLADAFLARFCAAKGRETPALTPDAKAILLGYTWPGNIRELEGVMERLCATQGNDAIKPEDLPEKIRSKTGKNAVPPKNSQSSKQAGFVWPRLADLEAQGMGLKEFLDEIETRLLNEALAQTKGAQSQMAELFKMKRTTLVEKLKKRGMSLK